ncbi:hypothetical protein IWQ60_008080 [Tieghemiomyces parasiticus]|uniref:Myb-like domain-containing protein n=1 Tax=Tieghemiomyces parasiticus TaxID=78921 RepID=A0A9W7ZZE0_9FUNG|nr:hypothetical protein IWQ60_008080 [Tieghemiomyces parasiticus]
MTDRWQGRRKTDLPGPEHSSPLQRPFVFPPDQPPALQLETIPVHRSRASYDGTPVKPIVATQSPPTAPQSVPEAARTHLPSIGTLCQSEYARPSLPPLRSEEPARRRAFAEISGLEPPALPANYWTSTKPRATTPGQNYSNSSPTENKSFCISESRTVATWRTDEIRELINWRVRLTPEFTVTKRNHILWEKISYKLRLINSDKTAVQCRHKWKNMSRLAKENDDFNRSRPPSEHRYFEFMDEVRHINAPGFGTPSPSVCSTSEGSHPVVPGVASPCMTASDLARAASASPALVTRPLPAGVSPVLLPAKRLRASTDPVLGPSQNITTLVAQVDAMETKIDTLTAAVKEGFQRLDEVTKILQQALAQQIQPPRIESE